MYHLSKIKVFCPFCPGGSALPWFTLRTATGAVFQKLKPECALGVKSRPPATALQSEPWLPECRSRRPSCHIRTRPDCGLCLSHSWWWVKCRTRPDRGPCLSHSWRWVSAGPGLTMGLVSPTPWRWVRCYTVASGPSDPANVYLYVSERLISCWPNRKRWICTPRL